MNKIIPKVIDKYNLSKWQIRDLISTIIVIIHYNHTVKDSKCWVRLSPDKNVREAKSNRTICSKWSPRCSPIWRPSQRPCLEKTGTNSQIFLEKTCQKLKYNKKVKNKLTSQIYRKHRKKSTIISNPFYKKERRGAWGSSHSKQKGQGHHWKQFKIWEGSKKKMLKYGLWPNWLTPLPLCLSVVFLS